MNDTTETIDLQFRPADYLWPQALETHLLARVKGARRREALKALLDAGRTEQIPDFLAAASLSEEERDAISAIHPALMGGEYLPDTDDDEIEIARIVLRSTLSDVTSVYARYGEKAFHYRVVDEYDGETLSGPAERSSDQPLTLAQLFEFFDRAWPLMEVLERCYPGNLQAMHGFFKAESAFYPQLDTLYRQRVESSFLETAN
jgi:hypothetical protein